MDLVQHLQTFVRIADSGNISRAARALQLSVPMASRHLRALEEHFGVALMRRTTRHAELTEAGTELAARARRILAGLDEARDALRPGASATGTLTLSVPVSFGLANVAPLVPKLLAKHPQLSLDLRLEDRVVDLLGDGVDLALRVGVAPPDSPFVLARKLASYHRGLFAAPAFAKKNPVRELTGLSGVSCILQGPSPARWDLETPEGPRSVVVNGRLRSTNIFLIRDAALAGVGVAQLPLWLVRDDVEAKRLVRLLPTHRSAAIHVLGLVHADALRSNALRLVQDWLAADLARTFAGH